MTAGAFSFGFIVSAVLSPSLGRLMDRRGPRVVMEMGVLLMAGGLMLATLVRQPWQLYATIGVMVGGGSVCLGYIGQALFLPYWFVRRRGLAMSLAYSGVGVGSIVILPWLQTVIDAAGWRAACWTMGLLVLVILLPINLLLRSAAPGHGARARRRPRRDRLGAGPARGQRGGPAMGRGRLDARAGGAHGAVLVDRARLLLWPLRLVRGAGAPDEVPHRDRVQPDVRRVGARIREPGGHPRPDRPRSSLGPHRSRVGLDRGEPRASRSASPPCCSCKSRRRRASCT